MNDDHVSPVELDRFARGAVSAEEACRVIEHLLGGCSRCAWRLETLLEAAERVGLFDPEIGDAGDDSRQYDTALDRAVARATAELPRIEEEKRQISRALPALRENGAHAIARDPRLAGLSRIALVEALSTVSFELRFEDPGRMVELAELARDLAGRLAAADHGWARVADCQARAWADLGNAYRIAERMEEAQEAFRRADYLVAEGSGDPLLGALVDTCRATLLSRLRELPEAFRLYDRAIATYRSVGDLHAAGRTLVQRGICRYHQGEARAALAELRQGQELLDPARDPRLATVVCQSLVEILAHLGEHAEAAQLLSASGLRRRIAHAPINRVKLCWTEGRILAGLGRPKRAERTLRRARQGFLELGQRYHAAHVALDLAAVRLELGQAGAVGELARESLAVFRELGTHREAEQAMAYLHQACEQERVTPSLLRQIGRFLERLEIDPRLRFEAPA